MSFLTSRYSTVKITTKRKYKTKYLGFFILRLNISESTSKFYNRHERQVIFNTSKSVGTQKHPSTQRALIGTSL